jgi:predicted nucleic acid-binding protein
MKAVDTNILIYARRGESSHHNKAVHLLQSLTTGSEPWVLPWPCIYGCLRVVSMRSHLRRGFQAVSQPESNKSFPLLVFAEGKQAMAIQTEHHL